MSILRWFLPVIEALGKCQVPGHGLSELSHKHGVMWCTEIFILFVFNELWSFSCLELGLFSYFTLILWLWFAYMLRVVTLISMLSIIWRGRCTHASKYLACILVKLKELWAEVARASRNYYAFNVFNRYGRRMSRSNCLVRLNLDSSLIFGPLSSFSSFCSLFLRLLMALSN